MNSEMAVLRVFVHVPEITVLLGISLHLAGGIVGAENAVGRCEIPHGTILHSLRGICHLHQQ